MIADISHGRLGGWFGRVSGIGASGSRPRLAMYRFSLGVCGHEVSQVDYSNTRDLTNDRVETAFIPSTALAQGGLRGSLSRRVMSRSASSPRTKATAVIASCGGGRDLASQRNRLGRAHRLLANSFPRRSARGRARCLAAGGIRFGVRSQNNDGRGNSYVGTRVPVEDLGVGNLW